MEERKWYVYALYSEKSDIIYVGMSESIERRLTEHNAGKVKSTKGHLPWILIYHEFVGERNQARIREKHFKGTSGRRKLRKLVK